MSTNKFVEITVQNHRILHGFDEDNSEIIEEVIVNEPLTKLVAVNRILSIGKKYILTSYGFDRLVYWEYEGDYSALKQKIEALSA